MDRNKQQLKKQVKKHIPKDWLCEIRIAYRILKEAINDIKRTGIINVVIITTMAAILTLFGVLFRVTLSLSTFVNELGNVLEISVYLKQGVSPSQITNIQNTIGNYEYVQKVSLKTKEESWESFKKELNLQEMSNPLPDTLRVKVDKHENIEKVSKKLKTISAVEELGYAEDFAKKMQFLTQIVHTSMFFVIIISAALTITIINNTIQLVIQSRKEEIEIMRLMGVSNWYIKIPLVMQGAFYGFVSSLLAILPLFWLQEFILEIHKFFRIPNPANAINIVIITLILVGTAFGASGSLLSIKKHLQV